MQRVLVEKLDDLDGSPAVETVRFGLDGAAYEIDLSEGNVLALRDIFSPLQRVARKVGGRYSKPKSATPKPSSPPSSPPSTSQASVKVKMRPLTREEAQDLRGRWAREKKVAVNPRGRLPDEIVRQYLEDMSGNRRAAVPNFQPPFGTPR